MSVKILKGKIISNKMDKTVVVAVDRSKRHPVYGKKYRNTKKIKARDDIGLSVGDFVTIEECKPFSKEVSFRVTGKITDKEEK
jgi:small subunit ribosomal protein S17